MERKELSIQEIQSISIEILKSVTDLCEELHLRYFLTYGTLIGAIRHKGFIPWDDDIDIMMPRKDYEELLSYFLAHKEDNPYLELFNPETCSDYPYMISRFCDNRYLLEVENEKPYGIGIFIDVYPLDGLGDTLADAIHFGRKGDILSTFCYQSTRIHYDSVTLTSGHKLLKAIVKIPVYCIAKIIGKNYFQRQLNKLIRIPYDDAAYVGPVVWLVGGEENIFPRKWFDELIDVPYEQYNFKVPKLYDKFLRKMYGDYMQLPPEKDRVGHHFYKGFRK